MPEFIYIPEAAARARMCSQSIRNWCVRHCIGTKVAGRWRVDPVALDRLLAGNTAASIEGVGA